MSSKNLPKSSCKHPCDKCLSPRANNLLLDESEPSVQTNEVHINGNLYANTPSPSSIESTSTVDRSLKSRSKSDFHPHMISKRRHRHDKLFHYTHSLNRQYIVTMTSILFQMQKDIFKLKRRTHHVEQMLANHTKAGQPIIRIPRLTKDEITTICIDDKEAPQNIASRVSENENTTEPSPLVISNTNPLNEPKEDTENSIPTQILTNKSPPIHLPKYCLVCDHEFSHRSAYLRHMRRIHHKIYPKRSKKNKLVQPDSRADEIPMFTTDQPEIENEPVDESLEVLVNHWDIGEGRLRPRRASKLNNESSNKVKCDICNKFYRAEYIKKHKTRTHGVPKFSSPNETVFTTPKPVDDVQSALYQSPTTSNDPPSTITVAEMDIDDIPIQFRKESSKPIVIAATCLQGYQLEFLEEFLQKFSPRVCQSSTVNSRTTHLITNDEKDFLRSPLSMKLIEGIANHCFCVSFRWLIDCVKYDRIIDESPYEIEGDDTENRVTGGPKRSRLEEKRHTLFEKIRFMIKCTEDTDIKMTNERLQELITSCGGKIITCVTQSLLNTFEIVVLCDKLYVSERRHNYDYCRTLGIHFVSPDWVLESILEYREKSFDSYEEIPL